MRAIFFSIALILQCSVFGDPALQPDVTVDLRNPTYKDGVLFTEQGGVIHSKDLRIQARSIQYFRRTEDGVPVHRIEAEGDLMIQYQGRVYVGSEMCYDFIKKSGTVFDAKTFSSLWYVGGDQIQLNPDGSFRAQNAFFTTCENIDSAWDLHAGRINVFKNDLIEAKKVRFRLFKIPTFWLPSFKINLRKFKEPIFRYTFSWDKGKPRASIRYQFYSWRDWALYGRLDYRLKTGFGGAFETEYFPPGQGVTFVTKSYLGSDRLENALDKQRRYRLQGALQAESKSQKTHTTLTWDKYSDVRMPNDFKSDDFEVNTAKRTQFYVHHKEKSGITSLKVRPRINTFESIKQDLPTFFFSARPQTIGKSGVMYNMWAKASYLDFVYSDQLVSSLPSMCSSRIELRPVLFRPFHCGPINITPRIGAVGIFYGSSEDHQSKGLAALIYGGSAMAEARKEYKTLRHTIQPYVNYYGLSNPTVSPDHHYIFGIQDGYHRLNQLQAGLRQCLFSKERPEPFFVADLYSNAFLAEKKIPPSLPRLYLLLSWNYPSVELSFHNCWNFRHQVLDFSNSRLRLTVNENAAFTLDLRYRSRYDWRKSDHEGFILDVTRSESELLDSPLSDRRLTVLTSAFFRLTPFWECRLQSHHGFMREKQGSNPARDHLYNEFKIDLFTWLSTNWKLRLSYSHTIKDDRVTGGISLIKK
ncbi:MAG: hypothetical protein HW387_1570 [Parachlamydiales bacterium]|nr:hypothetical protein [Parachlamydiales bacterium]